MPASVKTTADAENWIAANLSAYWGVDDHFIATVRSLSPLDLDLAISDGPIV